MRFLVFGIYLHITIESKHVRKNNAAATFLLIVMRLNTFSVAPFIPAGVAFHKLCFILGLYITLSKLVYVRTHLYKLYFFMPFSLIYMMSKMFAKFCINSRVSSCCRFVQLHLKILERYEYDVRISLFLFYIMPINTLDQLFCVFYCHWLPSAMITCDIHVWLASRR